MKKVNGLLWGLLFVLTGWCQEGESVIRLKIGKDKTLSLVFPSPVVHADRGSAAVHMQVLPQARNILLLRAAVPDFKETTLSVLTKDGDYYAFPVEYEEHADRLLYRIPDKIVADTAIADRLRYRQQEASAIRRDKEGAVSMQLSDIYVRDDIMYFRLVFLNDSPLGYTIGRLSFRAAPIQQQKRRVSQVISFEPLSVAGKQCCIAAGGKLVMVVAMHAFTLPEGYHFQVSCREQDGGRQLGIRLRNRQLLRAKPLPS